VRRFQEGKGHDGVSAPLRIDGVLDGGGEGGGVVMAGGWGRREVWGEADERASAVN
jgi:hypothetical protein